MIRAAAIALAALAPFSAGALTLELPANTAPMAERRAPLDSHFLATGPYRGEDEAPGISAEGALTQQSWKVEAGSLTTLQLLAPLRAQLEAAGYAILFECETRDCGGFDFRYRLDVLPEPDMHVNLGDFRYLAAAHAGAPEEFASLLVSRSANAGFIQLTRIGAPEAAMVTSTKTSGPLDTLAGIGDQLETKGFAILDDLRFATGSASLDGEDYASLESLAAYLAARPGARVMLVGHTDAEGALAGNIALSRRRAESAAALLIERHGIARDRVSADGIGYLAPRSSNLTPEGRMLNRRVEAILTTTE